jgi:tetraacyldisaccharide 4'-kinase
MRRPWLAPLVPLYRAGLAWRELRLRRGWEPIHRLQGPVISIGNLSTGGSGKTPLTIALANLLKARGFSVDVLSRGYRRTSQQPARVDPSGTSGQFGDEPLLIARATGVPVFVAPQRFDAGLLAESDASSSNEQDTSRHRDLSGSRISAAHILDDGFQHRQLHRTVDILLLNREDWQEDSLLPAGNLREPLRAAMRADVIAIPADDPNIEAELRRWGWTGPVWRLHRRMQVRRVDGPVFAFCGIARPAQFFTGLQHAGLHLSGQEEFRDHCDYTEQVVEWLLGQAKSAGAQALITTEKDAVRLGSLASTFPSDMPLVTASLQIEIEAADAAIGWLIERLGTPSATPAL